MADSAPLYSAEQITVPDALPQVLKEWTKEVIRANPADIIAWSAEYFTKKAEKAASTSAGAGSTGAVAR